MAGNQRETATAEYLVVRTRAMVDTGSPRCTFHNDPDEDARIKAAIRGYVTGWVIPYAEALAASLAGTATNTQLAMLDDTKERGY